MSIDRKGLRAAFSRRLESDAPTSRAARALASVWGTLSAPRVGRPLTIPAEVQVIGVGGATLGGSCKTPTAIELARELARAGERVALVGHAYRARPRRARVVLPHDHVLEVGDDALHAARALHPFDIPVIVAPSRQAALDFAAPHARYIVVDGLLQSRPQRLARSLLLLDAERPWGNGLFPPAGDLRAPGDALRRAADAVLRVRDALDGADRREGAGADGEIALHIDRACSAEGRQVSLRELVELGSARLGLLLTMARPQRVTQSLARRGIVPSVTVALGDHDVPTSADLQRMAAQTQRVDLWLTTAKCATKLPLFFHGAPVLALDVELHLPEGLIDWVRSDSSLPLFPSARAVVDCPPCGTPAGN